MPKILETLRDEGLKATFFVPGWTAEHHPQRTEMIVAGGHEVAHHSYSHNWIDPDYPDKEVEEMERGLEALKRVVGVVPRGYRSPAGESSDSMIRLLHEHGFLYDSSLSHHDSKPYYLPSLPPITRPDFANAKSAKEWMVPLPQVRNPYAISRPK